MVSLHWGSNWGYGVHADQVRFAWRLIDGGVDLVHGHSSHHPRPIEVFRGKLILYGCGDSIDDYEGITSRQAYRPDLRLLYFAFLEAGTGQLAALRMAPMQAARCGYGRPPPPTGTGSQRSSTGSAAASGHASICSRTACSPCARRLPEPGSPPRHGNPRPPGS